MPITLPELPAPLSGEKGPYCCVAIHRAKPGQADAYEKRMLADIALTRSERALCNSKFTEIVPTGTDS